MGWGTPDGFPSPPHLEGPSQLALLHFPSFLHPQELCWQRVPSVVSLEDRGGPRGQRAWPCGWRVPQGRVAMEDGGGPQKAKGNRG